MFLRGDVWWTWVGGVRRSTGCRDEQAARLWCAEQERLRVALGEKYKLPNARKAPKKNGVVYFMRSIADGFIKIGFAANLNARMAVARTDQSHGVELLALEGGSRDKERDLHLRFQLLRVRPHGEWFRPGPDLLAYIAEVHLRPRRRYDQIEGIVEKLRALADRLESSLS